MDRDWLHELFRDRGSDEDPGLRRADEPADPRIVDPPLPDEPLVSTVPPWEDDAATS